MLTGLLLGNLLKKNLKPMKTEGTTKHPFYWYANASGSDFDTHTHTNSSGNSVEVQQEVGSFTVLLTGLDNEQQSSDGAGGI